MTKKKPLEQAMEAKKEVRKRLPGSSVTVRPQNEKRRTYAGGGRALRGYGKAYMTGGRVGYKGGTLVGKYKTLTGGTGGRSK